jgi:hypothetical protein
MLIPVFDMLTHRNGRYRNADCGKAVRKGKGKPVKIRATRDIEEGRTIHVSYNLCIDCKNRTNSIYGTPELLRDYGFVEEYPQRWYFPEQEIAFDLDQTTSLDFKLRRVPDKHRHSQEGFRFLKEQLQRLKDLDELEFSSPDPAVPQDEFDAIARYHQALMVAMTNVIHPMEKKNKSLEANR